MLAVLSNPPDAVDRFVPNDAKQITDVYLREDGYPSRSSGGGKRACLGRIDAVREDGTVVVFISTGTVTLQEKDASLEERAAWDKYATGCLSHGFGSRQSAKLADDMLKSRRERFGAR